MPEGHFGECLLTQKVGKSSFVLGTTQGLFFMYIFKHPHTLTERLSSFNPRCGFVLDSNQQLVFCALRCSGLRCVFSPGHGERSSPAHPRHVLADPVGPRQPHQQGHAHPPSGVSSVRSRLRCPGLGAPAPAPAPAGERAAVSVAPSCSSGRVFGSKSSGKRSGVSSCASS